MDKDGAAFLKRLLGTFKLEADEHVRALSTGLIALEQAQEPGRRQELMESLFRGLHSLKGAARAVDRSQMERLCQSGESVLAALKAERIQSSAVLLDLLHGTVDMLGKLLATVEAEPAPAQRNAVAALCRRLDAAATGAAVAPADVVPAAPGVAAAGPALPVSPPAEPAQTPEPAAPLPPTAEERRPLAEAASTVRIQAKRLDAVLYQAEALIAAKLAAQARLGSLREACVVHARRQRERAKLMPEIRMLQRGFERDAQRPRRARSAYANAAQLRRLVDHIAAEDAFDRDFGARLNALAKATDQGARALGTQVDGLLDDLKQVLMLPIDSVFEGLAKLARDLSREQGKEVDFQTRGGGLEIDRRILEEVRDPLIHLVRNSLDHGIELPDARAAAGKPRRSMLSVTASQLEGSRIEIRIADDGAGLDPASLRASAQRLGLPLPAGNDEAGVFALAFESGVSTSALITDLSGRGLGLAIVREKVERLGGTVAVSSQRGAGTSFRLILPLTLATFRGVRVRAAGEEYIFPSMGLERVLRVRREEVVSIEGRDAIRIEGQAVALVRLADALRTARADTAPDAPRPAVVAGLGERRVAFEVDEVVGEQEVLVKSLGRQLRRVRNVAGATVLGGGQVVPILYLPDLLKSASRATRGAARPTVPARERKSLLVAEDSITSRILLKGILESAGYDVATAVDGVDAYTRLHTEPFDLLVSDVDMPRMNGFELTAKLRADPRLAELPVVLVTSLDSREDRERGADAGANAYLVKSSFDQSNLLATIRRLL